MQEVGKQDAGLRRGAFDLAGVPVFRPKQRADVRTRVVEGELLVLDRREGLVHQFNKTANFIWQRCNGSDTAEDISRALCAQCEVELTTAQRDVGATIEQLRRAKLLEDG